MGPASGGPPRGDDSAGGGGTGDAPGTGRESTDHARLADPRTAISRDGGASTREGPATTTAPQSSGRPADEPTELTTASREKRRRRSRWDAPGDADAVAPGPSDRTDAGAVVPLAEPKPLGDSVSRYGATDTEFDIDVDTSKSLERTPHAGTLLLPGGVLAKLPVSFLCERDAPPDADEQRAARLRRFSANQPRARSKGLKKMRLDALFFPRLPRLPRRAARRRPSRYTAEMALA